MLFSRNWLADYVELPQDVEEVARRLTFAGFAVEGIEPVGDDFALDIDVTTNRPDTMNHLGLARELAVLLDKPLRKPVAAAPEEGEDVAELASLTLEDPAGCPRYVARIVRGVRVGPSPQWLQERLRSIGLRSINNVVDVTNFILWEAGQPLHAFDLSRLAGPEIRVRRPRPGESLVTLDDEERKLDASMLVIADAERAVALAGVMGGRDSEVGDATRDILIESAHFDRADIRRMAKTLGMKTDASHRFERGTDPEVCREAADRAVALIAELAGGRVAPGALDERGAPFSPRRGRLELAALVRFAGADIPAAEVERILTGLGFVLENGGDGVWEVVVPSWRYFDFDPRPEPPHAIYPADLYEEVLRVWGYDRVASTLPALRQPDASLTVAQRRRRRVQDHLAACGYAEAINFAFHDRESDTVFPGLEPEAPPLEIANPLSERYEVMRRSLVPNLLASARFNRRRGAAAVSLFEIGHVFFSAAEPGRGERETVALVCGGRRGTPWDRAVEVDFFDLKGVVESLAHVLGNEIEVRPAELPGLVPGSSGEILVGGRPAGYLGRVREEGAEYPLFVAELATEAFDAAPGHVDLTVEAPSRFPGVAADLTLTHSLDVSWRELRAAVSGHAPADLIRCGLKDRYQGKGVPQGAVNSTLYFLYNSPARSLTQEEVNEMQASLTAELERRFGWKG